MALNRLSGGLKEYEGELDPDVIRDAIAWERGGPLATLAARLRSHVERKAFFDAYAEAVIARRLLLQGCDLRFEVPTPNGKTCDFEVASGDVRFFLHVKRLETDAPVRNPARLMSVSSQLRALERIVRPYIVQIRWHEGVSAEQMHLLVSQAAEFLLHAHIGDEMKARDHDGREIGGVRVIAPWAGSHVNVSIALPSGFTDQAPRFRRLLHRAYQQFMPRAANVIAIASGHASDQADFETALLGSHIERWDAFPPRGKRVAHGRASDGFWRGNRFADSRYAAWFAVFPGEDEPGMRLWRRQAELQDSAVGVAIGGLFGGVIR